MNLSEISRRLSNKLNAEMDYNDDKKEIITYGLESAILTITGFLAILLVAFLFNAVFPTVIAVIFGGLLRQLSGGAHFDTPVKCLAYGAIIYSLLGVISKEIVSQAMYFTNASILVLAFSLVVVALLAPVDCEAKPIQSKSFRKKLKIASSGLVVLTFVVILFSNNNLINTSAVLGIFYQTMTLLPVFNKKIKEV